MPFVLIRGTFHVVGRRDGRPRGFQPDGNSIQFKPDNVALLDRLRRRGRPHMLNSIDSVNLRFEGVDAPELHHEGARQPAPFAEDARDFVTGELGMNPISYEKDGITVKPPAKDSQRGYVLARELDSHGRPVSWVFLGEPTEADGQKVYLDVPRVQRSLNYKLVAEGKAFPLFYDSLFHELRQALTHGAEKALRQKCGVWQRDVLQQVTLISRHDAETANILYPKLFRRVADYLKDNLGVTDFVPWMDHAGENDLVWTLPEWNRTHFDNVLEIKFNAMRLTKLPMQLVFVSR
jgi:endonuclease YncB( thermonuclease family)